MKETSNEDTNNVGVVAWIQDNTVVVHKNMPLIVEWFDDLENATTLLELAHGAKVYDYEGQNISLNTCLTRSKDPDDIRQLIFFPDGHLRYDWVKKGAILI